MVPDLETARRVAWVSDAEAAVLASSERPIVVLASRGVLPPAIAPDVGSIGVMLPYTPLHHLLLEAFAALSPLPALVMTYVCASYIFVSPLMFGMQNRTAAYLLGGVVTLAVLVAMIFKLRNNNAESFT